MTIAEAKAHARQALGWETSEEALALAAIGLYRARSGERRGITTPQAQAEYAARVMAVMEALGPPSRTIRVDGNLSCQNGPLGERSYPAK
jgi:hypothetical protein